MNTEQVIDLRTTQNGEVDTAYYIAEAREMRGEFFHAAITALVKKAKGLVPSSKHEYRMPLMKVAA